MTDYFYFKSNQSDIVYKIKLHAIMLCGTFERVYYKNINSCQSVNSPLILEQLQLTEIVINSERNLYYIHKYLSNYQDTPHKANYVKERKLNTSNIYHKLNEMDVSIIEEYINEYYKYYTEKDNLDVENISENDKIILIVRILNDLLTQTDHLQIESLTLVIYTYLAVLLCSASYKSYVDFTLL